MTRTHTAVASAYICSLPSCQKSFSSSSHLRRHERQHLDKKPYVCSHCSKSFRRKEVWQRHEQLHVNPVAKNPRVLPVSADTQSSVSQSTQAGGPSAHASNHTFGSSSFLGSSIGNPTPAYTGSLWPTNGVSGNTSSQVGMSVAAASGTALLGDNPIDPTIYDWLDELMQSQGDPFNSMGLHAALSQQPPPLFDFFDDSVSQILLPTEVQVRLTLTWQRHGGEGLTEVFNTDTVIRLYTSGWHLCSAHYPILHHQWFHISTTSCCLLTALIALGAASSDQECDRAFAARLMPVARAIAATTTTDTPRKRLEGVQAYLLLALAGEFLGEADQIQSQAHVAHVMMLIQRYGYLCGMNTEELEPEADVNEQWDTWIMNESRRRTSWLCLVLDARQTTYGHHYGSRSISPFRLTIGLPSLSDCWNAPDGPQWAKTLKASELVTQALHRLITVGQHKSLTTGTQCCFGRMALIHCLAALVWDFKNRDVSVPAVLKREGPQQIDNFILFALTALTPTIPEGTEPWMSNLRTLVADAYDAAAIAKLNVLVDTISLEIYCGVSKAAMLQSIGPSDRRDAATKLSRWSREPTAAQAVVVAVEYLAQCFKSRTQWTNTIHHSWSMYYAYLTLWVYHQSRLAGRCEPDLAKGQPDLERALKLCLDIAARLQGDGHAVVSTKEAMFDSPRSEPGGCPVPYNMADLVNLGLVVLDLMGRCKAEIVTQCCHRIRCLVGLDICPTVVTPSTESTTSSMLDSSSTSPSTAASASALCITPSDANLTALTFSSKVERTP